MVTYLEEDRILFSCDFFGSHIATSDLFVSDEGRVHEAAKRYFAEIMMPFRSVIKKNLEKLASYAIEMIAPGHGELYTARRLSSMPIATGPWEYLETQWCCLTYPCTRAPNGWSTI